jgi:O-methyltransferase involved in polyketide biosynthesis
MVTTATPNPAALGSVQRTLLLPLWGRAVETKKNHPLLVDPTAARIIESIDYDFSTIATNISVVSQLAWDCSQPSHRSNDSTFPG